MQMWADRRRAMSRVLERRRVIWGREGTTMDEATERAKIAAEQRVARKQELVARQKREIRAWRVTPAYDPEPGSICNSGTTVCLATGEYLLGTSIGEALSPKIMKQLRRTDVARVVCDGPLVDAAAEFLRSGEGLHKIRVNGKMMTRADVANALSPAGEG